MLRPTGDAPTIDGDAAMRAMFRARKEVFIDLLKWDVPALAGEYELDHFDNADAEYLILLADGCVHRASARLLRTDRPHILGDLYPHLCAGPLPAGPTVREITRFCLDRHQLAGERRSARNQLVTALVEHALANGITGYTGVAERAWYEQIRHFGWECRALGQPVRHDRELLTALHIGIAPDTIERLRAAGIYEALTYALATTGRGGGQ